LYWTTEYYIYDATGNVMANYTESYDDTTSNENFTARLNASIWGIYGNSRVGLVTENVVLADYEFMLNSPEYDDQTKEFNVQNIFPAIVYLQNNLECMQVRGNKQYEQSRRCEDLREPSSLIPLKTYNNKHLSNHLGNVLVTLQDRKEPIIIGGGPVGSFADLYHPSIVTAADYYALGGGMEARTFKVQNADYKYGMNTQEKDDEQKRSGALEDHLRIKTTEQIYGKGNSTTAEHWQYDSRLGRRWNVGPKPNVSISSYACFGNNPLFSSDIHGDTSIVTNLATGVEIDRFDDGNSLNTILKVEENFYADFKIKFSDRYSKNPFISNNVVISQNLKTFTGELKEEAIYIKYLKGNALTASQIFTPPCHNYNWDENSIRFHYLYGSKSKNNFIATETSNSLTFNGTSLVWNTSFSDGTTMEKYNWGACSGNPSANSLPNGEYTGTSIVGTIEDGMHYKHTNGSKWGFKVYMSPNWALCPNGSKKRGRFRIHPDGNRANYPDTAGCIGLIDGEAVSKKVYLIFRDYFGTNNTIIINVNDPNNINDECNDNGINDSGSPGE